MHGLYNVKFKTWFVNDKISRPYIWRKNIKQQNLSAECSVIKTDTLYLQVMLSSNLIRVFVHRTLCWLVILLQTSRRGLLPPSSALLARKKMETVNSSQKPVINYYSTSVISQNIVTYIKKAFKNLKAHCIKFVSVLMLANPVLYYRYPKSDSEFIARLLWIWYTRFSQPLK
jgi:hypothetical protein